MRSGLEDNKSYKLNLQSALLGVSRQVLTGDLTIPSDGPLLYFLDPGASDRIVTLPSFARGRTHAVIHIGAASTLIVKDTNGSTIASLLNTEGALFVCSGSEWKYLTYTSTAALDPTEISSPLGTIDVQVIGGLTVTLDVIFGAIDHDQLLNYVADQHVAHSGVDIGTAANSGLQGGGDISVSRALSLDLNNLTSIAPILTDTFPFNDGAVAGANKTTFAVLNSILVHDDLVGFVADEHVPHSTISVTAGLGLTGGGSIDATRTISLDINGQTAAALVGTDEIIYWDVDGLDFNKRTFNDLISDLSILTSSDIGVSVQAYDVDLTTWAGISPSANAQSLVSAANYAAMRTLLDLEAGVDFYSISGADAAFQPLDADLTAIAALTPTDSNVIVGNGTAWVAESGATARTSLGLGTGDSPQFTGIEVGHASDSTLDRASAGQLQIEGVQIATISNSVTFTNKRHQPRVSSAASGDISPDVSSADLYIRTGLTAAITINSPSGSPAHGEKLTFRLKDNGTARALTWNAIFRAVGVTIPTTTTISKTVYVGAIYNSTDTKWDVVAVAQEA